MNKHLKNSKIRESNFELLRILAMFFIIIWHLMSHGIEQNLGFYDQLSGTNQILYSFTRTVTAIAVNLYVLISGYFLCMSNFKVRKLLGLMFEVAFFSILIYVISLNFNNEFSLGSTIKAFMPTFFTQYWFVTVYVLLYVFSPILNIIINNITKKTFLWILLVLFFIDCIWQYVYPIADIAVNNGHGILHFVLLYFIASYIRKFKATFTSIKGWHYLLTFVFTSLLVLFVDYILNHSINALFFYNSPFNLIISVSLFMFFSSFSFKSKFINTNAKYVFGVYLIHDNEWVRSVLWNNFGIIENVLNGNQGLFMLKIIGYPFIIFVICLLLSSILTVIADRIFNLFITVYNVFMYKVIAKENIQ